MTTGSSNGFESSRRNVNDDAGFGLDQANQPTLQRPRSQRYSAVTADGKVTGVVEEYGAEVRALVVGFGYEAAIHIGVTARFIDDKLSYVIESLHCVQAFIEHGVSVDGGYAAADYAERLARRVVIDRADCVMRVFKTRRPSGRRQGPTGRGRHS